MNAAIYIRVSSAAQAEGASLADQERACRDYARAHGYRVKAVYRDAGKSAWKEELEARPAFAKMLADSRAGRYQAVIVYKLDRFARRVLVFHQARGALEQAGVKLVSATETTDDSAMGRFASGLMAQVAQLYSDMLSERIKAAYQGKVSRGQWIGTAPYGYDRCRDGYLVPNGDADTVRWIFRAYVEGATFATLAEELQQRGVKPVIGDVWKRESVRYIIRNKAYIGIGTCDRVEYPCNHEPLVTEGLWRLAEQQRQSRTATYHVESRVSQRLPFEAFCWACGSKMWVTYGGKSSRYRRLVCARRRTSGDCSAGLVDLPRVVQQIDLLEEGGAVVKRVWVSKRGVERYE